MKIMRIDFDHLKMRLKKALREDGVTYGITTNRIPGNRVDRIHMILQAKADGIFCGQFLLKPLFSLLDSSVKISCYVKDGQSIRNGQVLARLHGTVYALFGGERLYLNLACHLSGVSSLTRKFVKAVARTKAMILDTRKTTPLWRDLEKYAVRCGGGHNHRFSLREAVLIKDNHLVHLRSKNLTPVQVYGIGKSDKLHKSGIKTVIIEARSRQDIWDGIKMRADVIMLDNMSRDEMKNSIKIIHAARQALGTREPLIEVSGGITLDNVRSLVGLGIDRVSVGALTHSAAALDMSMEVE